MSNISITGIGVIITVLDAILPLVGVRLEPGTVSSAINGIVSFVGFILLVWGQVRRKDLKYGFFRK